MVPPDDAWEVRLQKAYMKVMALELLDEGADQEHADLMPIADTLPLVADQFEHGQHQLPG